MASLAFRNRRCISRKPAQRASFSRRAFFEQLEDRRLLAAGWQNALLATDVNADRRVSPLDALFVINMLESGGSVQLPELAAGVNPNAYYDTTGDGFVSPLDALLVINAIEADQKGYTLTDVTSLSSHYIQATFDAPVVGALLSPDAYLVTGADSSRLEVVSVAEGEAPNQVILAMAAPAVGAMTVSFDPSVTAAISVVASIEGHNNDEFYLESSIALSNTSVLLTFSDPLDTETASVEQFYRIVATADGAPAQDVGHVAITEATVEGRTVILETSPLQTIKYQVKVTNVLDGHAKKLADRPKHSMLINPTRNTASFFGIPQSAGLELTSAVSTAETTILLTFNEPIAASGVNPTNFQVEYCTLSVNNGVCSEPTELVITAAELGTFVVSTFHTINAVQTITRMVNFLPPYLHEEVFMQLSVILKAVISLRLLPLKDGTGRIPAYETMVVTPTIAKMIREGKVYQIQQFIDGGELFGMQSFRKSLVRLVKRGLVAEEDARRVADSRDEFDLEMKGIQKIE